MLTPINFIKCVSRKLIISEVCVVPVVVSLIVSSFHSFVSRRKKSGRRLQRFMEQLQKILKCGRNGIFLFRVKRVWWPRVIHYSVDFTKKGKQKVNISTSGTQPKNDARQT